MIVLPEFDPHAHRYSYRGFPLISVTQALAAVGIIDVTQYRGEFAADKGTKVHAALHYEDEGDLDESGLDPAIAPYLEAWRKFKAEMSFDVTECESARASIGNPSFAGRCDRLGTIRDAKWLIDIKTGAPERWHAIQCAGYGLLWPGRRLANVYLSANQRYKFVERTLCTSFQDVFTAAARVAQWKQDNMKGEEQANERETSDISGCNGPEGSAVSDGDNGQDDGSGGAG